MTIEISQMLTIVFYTMSVVCFILAVSLFFIFKISKVIANITGISAKKEIDLIKSGNMMTAKIPLNKKIKKPLTGNLSESLSEALNKKVATHKYHSLDTSQKENSSPINQNVTQQDYIKTQINVDTESGVQSTQTDIDIENGTTVLSGGIGETSVLSPINNPEVEYVFEICVEIAFSQSNEVI